MPFEEFIERYTDTYTRNKVIQKQKKLARETEIPSLEVYRLQPILCRLDLSTICKKYMRLEKIEHC